MGSAFSCLRRKPAAGEERPVLVAMGPISVSIPAAPAPASLLSASSSGSMAGRRHSVNSSTRSSIPLQLVSRRFSDLELTTLRTLFFRLADVEGAPVEDVVSQRRASVISLGRSSAGKRAVDARESGMISRLSFVTFLQSEVPEHIATFLFHMFCNSAPDGDSAATATEQPKGISLLDFLTAVAAFTKRPKGDGRSAHFEYNNTVNRLLSRESIVSTHILRSYLGLLAFLAHRKAHPDRELHSIAVDEAVVGGLLDLAQEHAELLRRKAEERAKHERTLLLDLGCGEDLTAAPFGGLPSPPLTPVPCEERAKAESLSLQALWAFQLRYMPQMHAVLGEFIDKHFLMYSAPAGQMGEVPLSPLSGGSILRTWSTGSSCANQNISGLLPLIPIPRRQSTTELPSVAETPSSPANSRAPFLSVDTANLTRTATGRRSLSSPLAALEHDASLIPPYTDDMRGIHPLIPWIAASYQPALERPVRAEPWTLLFDAAEDGWSMTSFDKYLTKCQGGMVVVLDGTIVTDGKGTREPFLAYLYLAEPAVSSKGTFSFHRDNYIAVVRPWVEIYPTALHHEEQSRRNSAVADGMDHHSMLYRSSAQSRNGSNFLKTRGLGLGGSPKTLSSLGNLMADFHVMGTEPPSAQSGIFLHKNEETWFPFRLFLSNDLRSGALRHTTVRSYEYLSGELGPDMTYLPSILTRRLGNKEDDDPTKIISPIVPLPFTLESLKVFGTGGESSMEALERDLSFDSLDAKRRRAVRFSVMRHSRVPGSAPDGGGVRALAEPADRHILSMAGAHRNMAGDYPTH